MAIQDHPSIRSKFLPKGMTLLMVEKDPVNNPAHYTSHPSGIEAIEVTRHYNFAIGNAIKYLWRAGLKEDAKVQDLRKAIWYIEDEIKRIEGNH